MDSASHFAVGIGLAGLAQLDPVVHSNPTLSTAVIVGTIVGSQAPDFDTITRLFSNETYIRQHRGISHSFPAIIVWTLLITTILYWFVDQPNHYAHLLGWILLAVFLHVFMDLFNTYGTQALRPLSRKWISWNIIHIFDPFIFFIHIVAATFWILNLASPKLIFPFLYSVLLLYYLARTLYHHWLVVRISRQMSIDRSSLTVMPTIRLRHWHLMIKHQDGSYELGTCNKGRIHWHELIQSDQHELIDQSSLHPSVAALLHFTSHTCANVTTHHWGTEVRWCDVRYRYRKQYPFVAIVFYDHEQQPIASYVGWLNDKKLYRRLYQQADLTPSS